MNKTDDFRIEFQERLKKRIEARNNLFSETISLTRNLSGTGILTNLSINGFPAYAPAFIGLFAFHAVYKIYNVVQQKNKAVEAHSLDSFTEDFYKSNLSIKDYVKQNNLSNDEKHEFLTAIHSNKTFEQSIVNIIEKATGDESIIESQINHIAYIKRKTIKKT